MRTENSTGWQRSNQAGRWMETKLYRGNSKGPKVRRTSVIDGRLEGQRGPTGSRGAHRAEEFMQGPSGDHGRTEGCCKRLWGFCSKRAGSLQESSTRWNDQNQPLGELLRCWVRKPCNKCKMGAGTQEQEPVTSWGPWQQSEQEAFATWSSDQWPECVYSLQIDPTGFPDGLNIAYERKERHQRG